MNIIEIIIGLLAVAALLYLLWRHFQKSVSFYKEISEGKVHLHVTANCKVKKIIVTHTEKKGKPTNFVRTNVARGEDVEFVFPVSSIHEKLLVECEKGTFEYEVE